MSEKLDKCLEAIMVPIQPICKNCEHWDKPIFMQYSNQGFCENLKIIGMDTDLNNTFKTCFDFGCNQFKEKING